MIKLNSVSGKFILLFCFFSGSIVYSQSISLPGNWLFKPGDDPSYKQTAYDDIDWIQMTVPSPWENKGFYDMDGFAWYRLHFSLDTDKLPDSLYLLLGKIDDADETFLNGELVGSSGKMPPDAQSEWNTQRAYKIPSALLKDDNVLAVRVYDQGAGGGIHGGIIGLFGEAEYIKELNLGPAPKKSFFQITTSNGLIAAVYNEKTNVVENVFPHIFRMYDLDKPVYPFIKNLKLNTEEKPVLAGYWDNTHIINIAYPDYTVKLFAPFGTEEKILYAAAEGDEDKIKNLSFSYEKDYCEVITADTLIKDNNGKPVKYFLFSFNDSLHNNNEALQKALTDEHLNSMVNVQHRYMRYIIENCYMPEGLSEDEKNLYEQSISILKMGQVSQDEIFEKSRGQILASLPPGNWNIGWLRDAIYSVLALNRLGLYTEAKNALSFFLNADAGYYKHYVHEDGIDHGVKTNYRLSVCRYFGIGKEESDFNDNGPNIELDGFGLFLIAFNDYVKRSGDKDFLNNNYDVVSKLIADPIITFIEDNNLIRIESGPWESHLPGKQYAFTSIVNSAGLRYFAKLCEENSIPGYEKYREASERLQTGIMENLVYEGKLLKGFNNAASPETMDFYDGGTIEAFNQEVIDDGQFFNSYFSEYEKGLRISDRRGFSRLNNPDWYTIGEWPFLNLRFSSALIRFGRKADAKKLIDWTTNYSKMNFNYIAELYDYKNENYDGAIPMVGYGAGAYIITLGDYYNK